MNAIEIRKLAKRLPADFRGRRADLLHDINLAVPAGSCHGFVGPNGAGKSTTLRILMGAARPTTGEVSLFGVPSTVPRARAQVGFAPDIAAHPPTLTALEVCTLHEALLGATNGGGVRPDEALRQVDLFGRRDSRVGSFSKGMQQRLSLAVALLGAPRLLVLDEPMSGLDPTGRELVRQVIRERHQAGVTVLFSSHVLSDVAELCDGVTVIARGRTIYSGPLDDVLGDAQGHLLTFIGPDLETTWAGPGVASLRGSRLLVEVDSDTMLRDAIDVGLSRGLRLRAVESIRARLEERIAAMVQETT